MKSTHPEVIPHQNRGGYAVSTPALPIMTDDGIIALVDLKGLKLLREHPVQPRCRVG